MEVLGVVAEVEALVEEEAVEVVEASTAVGVEAEL